MYAEKFNNNNNAKKSSNAQADKLPDISRTYLQWFHSGVGEGAIGVPQSLVEIYSLCWI